MDGSLKSAVELTHNRLVFVSFVFLLLFSTVAIRLVDLSFRNDRAGGRGVAEVGSTEIDLRRGNIVDRNGLILATSLKLASIYADGRDIIDPKDAAKKLTALFPDLDYKKLLKKLSSKKQFIWVKRNLHPEEFYEVNKLGIPGVYYKDEEKRVYPQKNLFSHVLGFVGIDGRGLSGLERQFNDLLASEGNHNGSSELQLSLDLRVQNVLHSELKQAVEKFSAKGGAGVVVDINTGEILSLVSLPDFDPNVPEEVNAENTFNNATKALFEMGSTFKAFTVAAALDSGAVKMQDVFETKEPLRMGRFRIRDYHPAKWDLTTPEILVHSSNIGTARIVDVLTAEVQKDYLHKLNLLDELKLEIPETSSPQYPRRWGRLSAMTIGYGHGISVSPLHVASAMGAVVNGGTWISPTLLLDRPEEEVVKRRVFSEKTSDLMRIMLRLVVSEGTASKADANGYMVGGKTGTAEKPSNGRYARKKMVSSFAGVFPSNNPKYAILASLDEPKGIKETWGYATAGWTAAPVVGKVVAKIGPMLGIKPVVAVNIENSEPYLAVRKFIKKENEVATR